MKSESLFSSYLGHPTLTGTNSANDGIHLYPNKFQILVDFSPLNRANDGTILKPAPSPNQAIIQYFPFISVGYK